jgi:hypothetical protein
VIARGTGCDTKTRVGRLLWHFFNEARFYPRSCRCFRAKSFHEAKDFCFPSGVDLDDDSARIVECYTRKLEPVGKFLDEGTEPYALNDTFQNDAVSRKRLT